MLLFILRNMYILTKGPDDISQVNSIALDVCLIHFELSL